MLQNQKELVITNLEQNINVVRGFKVMLDTDLAKIYDVTVKRLLEQVRRNQERFPQDFMFQLKNQEVTALRSHFATLKRTRGLHRKYLPFAFTEHGAVMLANILRSQRAVQASIQVIRAFVRLRELAITHVELAQKIKEMEKKYDKQFQIIFNAIRALMTPPKTNKRKIGFLQS